MTARTERRQKLRNRPPHLVYVELESANGGMMRDLSEEGFALRAMMPLRAGQKSQFAFSLDEATRISGDARIVWVEDDGHVAGLEFSGLSATSRRRIHEWLADGHELLRERAAPKALVPEAPTFEELRHVVRTGIPPMALPQHDPVVPSSPPQTETVQTSPTAEASHEVSTEVDSKVHSEQSGASPAEVPMVLPSLEPPSDLPSAVPPGILESAASREIPPAPSEVPPETREPWQREASALEPLPALENESSDAASTTAIAPERFTLSQAIGIMVLLTLVAGGFVFHRPLGHALIWLGGAIAGPEPRETSPSSVNPASQPVTPAGQGPSSPDPAAAAPASSERDNRNGDVSTPASSEHKTAAPGSAPKPGPPAAAKPAPQPALSPMSQVIKTNPPAMPADSTADPGAAEYQQALPILRNKSRESELPEAVRLLWIAVEKGNPSAEIVLADLYRQGHGVTKNCDQTRILLTAAARKGSSEAQNRLQQFERDGCK